MQLQADVLGVPVVRPKLTETTAFGAAFLAGLATGVWKDREAIRRVWKQDRRFAPRMTAEARGELLARWRRAIEAA
jgi:glycerol kinase